MPLTNIWTSRLSLKWTVFSLQEKINCSCLFMCFILFHYIPEVFINRILDSKVNDIYLGKRALLLPAILLHWLLNPSPYGLCAAIIWLTSPLALYLSVGWIIIILSEEPEIWVPVIFKKAPFASQMSNTFFFFLFWVWKTLKVFKVMEYRLCSLTVHLGKFLYQSCYPSDNFNTTSLCEVLEWL